MGSKKVGEHGGNRVVRPPPTLPSAARAAASRDAAAKDVREKTGAYSRPSSARPSGMMLDDPRMTNPKGGTVKKLLTSTPSDHDVGAGRAVAELRAMLELTTRPGVNQAAGFEPRGITGELVLFGQRWDNPALAVEQLMEFCRPPSESGQKAFLRWFAEAQPEKFQAHAAAIVAAMAPDSAPRQAFARHLLELRPAVEPKVEAEAVPGLRKLTRTAGQLRDALIPTGKLEVHLLRGLSTTADKMARLVQHAAHGLATLDGDGVQALATYLTRADGQGRGAAAATEELSAALFGVAQPQVGGKGVVVPPARRMAATEVRALVRAAVRLATAQSPEEGRQARATGREVLRLLGRASELRGQSSWFMACPFDVPPFAASARVKGG